MIEKVFFNCNKLINSFNILTLYSKITTNPSKSITNENKYWFFKNNSKLKLILNQRGFYPYYIFYTDILFSTNF